MGFDNWYCRECGWFPEPETWKGPLPNEYVKHDCMPVTAIRTDELDRLRAENARLREALEFYSNLKKGSYSIVLMNVDKWGLRAREALKGGE